MVSRRRITAVSSVLALAVAGALGAPPPASAAVISAPLVGVFVRFNDHPASGVTCTTTGLEPSVQAPFAADGAPVTQAASSTGTIQNDTVGADKTTLSASGSTTIVATQANGQLSHVTLTANTSASVTSAAAGTTCGAQALVGPNFTFDFDLTAPMLVTLHVEAHHFQGQLAVGRVESPSGQPNAAAVVMLDGSTDGTSSALLPAGTGYSAGSEMGLLLGAPATAGTVSGTGDLKVDISFEQPGVARTSQQGPGGKYVALAGARNCETGAVAATWSKKAGKGKARQVKKATVWVDGDKVATVRKPKKKQVTSIPADPGHAVQVQLFLKVKGKGELIAQRSYRPCS
jgi:hypothetical protein